MPVRGLEAVYVHLSPGVADAFTFDGTDQADSLREFGDVPTTVDARGGDDTIATDTADDTVQGGPGTDTADTGGGQDTCTSVEHATNCKTGRVTLSPREATFVLPFYLSMMRTNATEIGEQLWDELVGVGRSATLDDVLWLLREGAWRPVVMGAWLSLRFDRGEVGAAVSEALQESGGSLTAAPLTVAAVTLLGEDAATVLRQSRARSDEHSVPFLDAALNTLGAGPAHEVNEQSRVLLSEMLAVGKRLRSSLTGP